MTDNIERFTFFYSQTPFSQWYPCEFKDKEGNVYNCAEQYMMADKARLFADEKALSAIMNAKHPREQKALGRTVKNFDSKCWDSFARLIVYTGNYLKFTQNKKLLKKLLETKGTTLVEASPTDKIWGIGLSEDDPRALARETWRGKNWLGETLTLLRDDLLAGKYIC